MALIEVHGLTYTITETIDVRRPLWPAGGMHERAELIGARVANHSSPTRGTEENVTVAFSRTAAVES